VYRIEIVEPITNRQRWMVPVIFWFSNANDFVEIPTALPSTVAPIHVG